MPLRHQNKLNLSRAAKAAKRHAPIISRYTSADAPARRRIQEVHGNEAVLCHIFDRSVAFRIGRRSIKSIKGFSRGYKSATRARAHQVFLSPPNPRRARGRRLELEMAARYFLMKSPSRVRTVSDPSDRAESEELDRFRGELRKAVDSSRYGTGIDLSIGDDIFRVDDIVAVPGLQKADMVFMYKGDPIVYVSHKMGAKAGDFRQYGGFVVDMGLRDNVDFERLRPTNEAKKFQADVCRALKRLGLRRNAFGRYDFSQLRPGCVFARSFRKTYNTEAMSAVFGRDWDGDRGPNSVDVIVDGRMILSREHITWELNGEHHLAVHPRINDGHPPYLDKLYRPTMLVMRSPSKRLVQAGFQNCRASVWPKNRWALKGIHTLEAVLSANAAQLRRLKKTFTYAST